MSRFGCLIMLTLLAPSAAAVDTQMLQRCFAAHASIGEAVLRLYLIREDYPGPMGNDAVISFDIEYADGWGFTTVDQNDSKGRYIDHYFRDDEGYEAAQFVYQADGIAYQAQSDDDRYQGLIPYAPVDKLFEFMGDQVSVTTATDGCYVNIVFPEGGGESNWINRDGHLRRITQLDDPADMENFRYNQVAGLSEPADAGMRNEYKKESGRVVQRTTYEGDEVYVTARFDYDKPGVLDIFQRLLKKWF